jgi:hypothetical protein
MPAKRREPLCPIEALPLQGWRPAPPRRALPRLLRSYGLMRQTQTLSPTSSLPSSDESSQVVVSPCWEWAVPDVISANLSPRAWTPTPVVLGVHLPVSSPKTTAFPTLGTGRPPTTLRTATSVRAQISRLQSFTDVQARGFARHPGCSYRCDSKVAWQPWLLLPSRKRFVTSPPIGYASRPNRATDGRGLSPHRTRSLVGCSPNGWALSCTKQR